VDSLLAAQRFPVGVALLTGTALVPAPEFTLAAGDQVSIALTGLGRLDNVVEVVDASTSGRRD
jgi:2-dehydro-3-deoxy-D-arabinonate dehydratase